VLLYLKSKIETSLCRFSSKDQIKHNTNHQTRHTYRCLVKVVPTIQLCSLSPSYLPLSSALMYSLCPQLVCWSVCMCVCVCACVYACVCVCVCVCMHVRTWQHAVSILKLCGSQLCAGFVPRGSAQKWTQKSALPPSPDSLPCFHYFSWDKSSTTAVMICLFPNGLPGSCNNSWLDCSPSSLHFQLFAKCS
jgi:hypothetical protein